MSRGDVYGSEYRAVSGGSPENETSAVPMVFDGATVCLQGIDCDNLVPVPDGIPGAEYAPVNPDLNADGAVVVEDSDSVKLEFDEGSKTLRLRCPANVLDGTQPLYLAQSLAEGIRQPRGYFLMHAAATVSPEGEGHLLVGNQGYGKTVTALALCLQKGHRLIGNDLVVMRAAPDKQDGSGYGMQFIGGTKYVHLRETAVQANQFLGDYYSSNETTEQDESRLPSFMKKVRIDCDEIGVVPANESVPVPVNGVWQMWLDGKKQETPRIVDQPLTARNFFFSERLGRHVSGIISPVLDSEGRAVAMVPSMDSDPAREQRLKAAVFLGGECKLVTGPDGEQAAAMISRGL